MSETEDRQFCITWRSILRPGEGGPAEVLVDKTLTAAYYRRDEDRYVFKRADGLQVFDISAALVETIECLVCS